MLRWELIHARLIIPITESSLLLRPICLVRSRFDGSEQLSPRALAFSVGLLVLRKRGPQVYRSLQRLQGNGRHQGSSWQVLFRCKTWFSSVP